MTNIPGSSSIPVFRGVGLIGSVGPDGPTGPTGITGSPGQCLPGVTGIGISGITVSENNLILTFGTADNQVNILHSSIKGNTGTNSVNDSVFNIQASSLSGHHIFQTFSPEEFSTRSVTFSANPNQTKTPKFLGITFNNIDVIDGATFYKIKSLKTLYSPSGSSGQLAYVDQSLDKFTVRGASGTLWDPNIGLLRYVQNYTKEIDNFSSTDNRDNYRSGNINNIEGTVIDGEWGSGITFTIPVTTISGNTGQSGLIVSAPTNIKIPFFSTNHSSGNTANLLVGGATLGSCFLSTIPDPRKRCVDFISEPYCKSIQGSWSINPCSNREEVFSAVKTCCIYSYELDKVTCIETFESECLQFMGLPGNLSKCSVYEGIMKKCSNLIDLCLECDSGQCCYKGICTEESEYDCITKNPGAVWFSGKTC